MKAKLLFCLLTACILSVTACGSSPAEIATQTPVPGTTVAAPSTATATLTPVRPTSTPTKTNAPTMAPTLTPLPPGSILFQKDFEDGLVGGWQQIDEGGIWIVEQEPDGNHCLCGTGPSINPPQIWYRDRRTLWTDYAFETRVKFIKGHTLYLIFRNDLGSNNHYGVALNDYGLSLMRTWVMIGRNFPMVPYPDRWYTFKVEIKGDSLSIYLDNLLFEELTLQPPVINQGGIGYVIDGGDKVCLDDIKVWSLK